jgi:mRNA-degrading endonuclease toxin of MazEF toxin-antitoxin module
VWLADLGLAAKTRPVIVVSRFDPDGPRALVTELRRALLFALDLK